MGEMPYCGLPKRVLALGQPNLSAPILEQSNPNFTDPVDVRAPGHNLGKRLDSFPDRTGSREQRGVDAELFSRA
jgi:hypothetical protein